MTAIKYLEGGIWKTLTMPSAVHVGTSAPDPNVKPVWVDTDEPGNVAPLSARLDALEAAPTWIDLPALQSGVTHYDQGQYSKDALAYVQCRGEIRAPAGGLPADSLLWTFTTGFVPVKRAYCTTPSNLDTARQVYVSPNGQVRTHWAWTALAVVSLNEVRFPTR